MTRQRLKERRERNRELAAQDAANRCSVCRRDLREAGQIIEAFVLPGKFCSDACLRDVEERSR